MSDPADFANRSGSAGLANLAELPELTDLDKLNNLPDLRDPTPTAEQKRPARRAKFLERQTYRRARLEDAARLLPVLGLFLFISPIAIQSTIAGAGDGMGSGGGTGRWLLFFMAIWLGLIGLSALVSRALSRSDGRR